MKNAISLFSNIGVSDAYLDVMDVKLLVSNDIDEERCNVFKKIYPKTNVICGDITSDVIKKSIVSAIGSNRIDFLIATPPCQGFSTLNCKKKDDPRNFLLTHALEIAKKLQPFYILIENVPRMLTQNINGISIIDFIKYEMNGYVCNHHILDAADYGTPQSRRRVFILLSKIGLPDWQLPKKEKKITLSEAIGFLPSLESKERLTPEQIDKIGEEAKWHFAQKHSKNHIDWMSHTPTGKSAFENYGVNEHYPHIIKDGVKVKIKGYLNTYKRMFWDKPANTLIAGNTMISSSNTVHPGREKENGTYSDARTLSVLEAMIVMGLPRNWNLPADLSYRKAIHYIGEGLCPQLLKRLITPLF